MVGVENVSQIAHCERGVDTHIDGGPRLHLGEVLLDGGRDEGTRGGCHIGQKPLRPQIVDDGADLVVQRNADARGSVAVGVEQNIQADAYVADGVQILLQLPLRIPINRTEGAAERGAARGKVRPGEIDLRDVFPVVSDNGAERLPVFGLLISNGVFHGFSL